MQNTNYPSVKITRARQHTPYLASRETTVISKAQFEFTVAQVARAACQAIRLAVREGSIRDAYYVVNSMLQSPSDPRIKPPVPSHRLLNPIKFGRPVPSRLAAHSLINGLLREGLTLEAGREIKKMIAIGIRFHTRTLEANVNMLCSGSSRVPKDYHLVDNPTTEFAPFWEDSEASRTLASQSTRLSLETQLALNLVSIARQSRHRRTERIYGWLVDACLLQGEIIVATLLFVILVKDWQLRRIVRSSPDEFSETMAGKTGGSVERVKERLSNLGLPSLKQAKRLGMDDLSLVIPYPDKSILQNILNNINLHVVSRDSQDKPRLESIESLSVLANLLRQRSLPFGRIGPLLRTLQNCPTSPKCMIAVIQNGRYVDVDVYDQVHEVLERLCRRLSASRPRPSLERPALLPRLDLRAYNCLIHYALRHRHSPALADHLIEHMTVHRNPPLSPDIVTYNTLLRSASLLRRNDVASKVLDKLRERHENSDHVIAKAGSAVVPPLNVRFPQRNEHSPSSFALIRERVEREQMAIPKFVETPRRPLLRADLYTLSSYITHLVSIGRPDLVADKIFYLLPELHIIDHPAGNSFSARQWTAEQRLLRRRECIARAVEYGPFVFSALLNALSKAGKTGLAERVWLLARQAERASWMPRSDPHTPAPWCLPIHAYTSIMQCYANESRKGLASIRRTRFSDSLAASLASVRRESSWVPQRSGGGKVYVKGWAHYFLKMQAREQGFPNAEPPLRWTTARTVGWLLHSTMREGTISVLQELLQLQQAQLCQHHPKWAARLRSLELPVPDARFFNVVLSIFGRRPKMQARRARASPSWWNRKLRITRRHFGSTGWLCLAYDHTLVEVARRMAQAGYILPVGLQRVLVGRSTFRVREDVARNRQVRPWAFPNRAKPSFQPFTLPVTRTRGLPFGRLRPPLFSLLRRKRRSSRQCGNQKPNA